MDFVKEIKSKLCSICNLFSKDVVAGKNKICSLCHTDCKDYAASTLILRFVSTHDDPVSVDQMLHIYDFFQEGYPGDVKEADKKRWLYRRLTTLRQKGLVESDRTSSNEPLSWWAVEEEDEEEGEESFFCNPDEDTYPQNGWDEGEEEDEEEDEEEGEEEEEEGEEDPYFFFDTKIPFTHMKLQEKKGGVVPVEISCNLQDVVEVPQAMYDVMSVMGAQMYGLDVEKLLNEYLRIQCGQVLEKMKNGLPSILGQMIDLWHDRVSE